MTYGELPNFEIVNKLRMVSFKDPKKNLEVYRFFLSVKDIYTYLEEEQKKIVVRYGTDRGDRTYSLAGDATIEAYKKDLENLFDMEIVEEDIYNPNLNEEDFETCYYPNNTGAWLSALEIDMMLRMVKELRKNNPSGT